MRHFVSCFLLGCLLITGICPVRAQSNKQISGDFSGLSFEQFVSKVEATTPYRVYFQLADLDTIIVQLKVSQGSLKDVLDDIFQNSSFHYAVDSSDRVFILRRAKIQTDLPPDFFNKTKL